MTGSRQQHDLLPGFVARAAAYDQSGLEPGVHRGLPSPWVTLVVSTRGPVRTLGTVGGPAGPVASADVLVAGLHPVATRVEQPVEQSGVQLAVHPLAARRLLGCRAADLTGHGTDARELLGPDVERLHEQVALAGPDDRLAVVRAWAQARLAATEDRRRRVRPEVVRVHQRVLASRGRVRVEDLAGEVGLSPRRLREQVRAELGVSPKQLVRTARLDHVVARLRARPPDAPAGLAGLALDAGFADQAHLAREFTAMAGCAPTAWLAEERRNLQDDGPAPAPGSSP